jgi:hypothetical protein
MMGRLKHEQEQLFYEFELDKVVPDDHLVREIAAVLDLSWVRAELASYYSPLGRNSSPTKPRHGATSSRPSTSRPSEALGGAGVNGGLAQPTIDFSAY